MFWRQVVARSPGDSATALRQADVDPAMTAHHRRLMALLRSGRSLSGNERNCAFLNTGDGRFATVSRLTGIDFPDDGRAVGLTDWDADGDIDIWLGNRSGPQVRFLRNGLAGPEKSVSLRLRGVSANRDAIGATALLTLDDGSPPLRRTVRAGEGYVSQSSKWLHFGLGQAQPTGRVTVDWPGGGQEEFTGVEGGGRYLLVQGGGNAEPWSPPSSQPPPPREPDPREQAAESGERRVFLSLPTPLPPLAWIDAAGKTGSSAAAPEGRFTLYLLWTTGCASCLAELESWRDAAGNLPSAGLDVVLLEVQAPPLSPDDSLETDGFKFLQGLSVNFPAGRATAETLQRLHYANDILYGRITTLTVPRSYLVDGKGRLRAIYRGPVSAQRVVDDAVLCRQPDSTLESQALPFRGIWIDHPRPLVPVGIPADLATRDQFDDAHAYAQATLEDMRRQPLFATVAEWLGDEMLSRRRATEAAAYYRESLALDSNNLPVMNNLAYLLSASPEAALRDGAEALHWAKRAHELTAAENPSVLDTLAAALAETGDFAGAAASARQALALARTQNMEALAAQIQGHLQLFLDERPLRDDSLSSRP